VTLDFDATLVDAHSDKQCASPTYKRGFGFHPLGVWCDETGEALAAMLRPGNAGANTASDHVKMLDAALAQLPPAWQAGHRRGDDRLEAGPTTPFESYHDFSTDVVVVVGPAWRSAMTARRLVPMVGERRMTIVANRFRDEPDHPGLPPAIRIPNDPELTQAEREGRSPFEACPGSPAVEAIGRLADLLLEQSAGA
jgi:hypothetical protein